MKARPFETEAAQSTAVPRRQVGTLLSRIMITEREPLFDDGDGMTPGQLIDKRIGELREEWARNYQGSEMRQPEIHSITLELPTDY